MSNNNNTLQHNTYNQPLYNSNDVNNQSTYSNNQQSYLNNGMMDTKIPFTNDIRQPGEDYNKNAVPPSYGVNNIGPTPMQKEQQQILRQQQLAKSSGGYPGVAGGTPAEARGAQGYDTQGNPIIPPFIAERHRIEQSLGPTCTDGGYHDLRMLLTTKTLLFAILIIPYCCGYRGKRECICKKCKRKFPNIVLPSAPQ